jgi:uncharacterized protein (DUF2141 family)
MNKHGVLLVLALACYAAVFAESAAGTHEVAVDCLVNREGVLFAYVVDEGGFTSPLTGFRELRLRLGPAEVAAGTVRFSFILPTGRYGIRCFLDLNGNGRLDRGPFGPSEPWGMSWNAGRRLGFPKFEDIAFMVDEDIRGLRIEVR